MDAINNSRSLFLCPPFQAAVMLAPGGLDPAAKTHSGLLVLGKSACWRWGQPDRIWQSGFALSVLPKIRAGMGTGSALG